MAAYAALVSLVNTLDQIQNHPRLSKCFDQKQIQSLSEKVDSLLAFVEKYTSYQDLLESQIASAAHAAEDVIEFHIVDQIQARSTENSSMSFRDLQSVIQEFDSVKEKTMKVKEERGFKDLQPKYSMPAPSTTFLAAGKTAMVGFDDYFKRLMDVLTGDQRQRIIIPITGMGGIGKTTLARNIYENLVIGQYFQVRAWVTVSQEYSVRKILFEILSCLGESTREMDEKTESELSEKMYKTLTGRKYLVILDDIWSIDAWNKIKFYLPDNFNKSRMLVTTRQSDVADYFSSSALALQFLDVDKSWELFCLKAFNQQDCPSELQKFGKEIVRKCKGLPLSVSVIGGLLGKSKTPEFWESVANDISSILDSAGDSQYENVLSLSYDYLPACLKPCFLYLGIFPEDHEFRVSRLIKLWIAEGLVKPNKEQNLEDIAKGFIKDLIDRNLVLVCSLGSNGKLKTCKIHDLLRDICIRVVEKVKFLCFMKNLDTSRHINKERHIINHGSAGVNDYSHRALGALEQTSLVRSLICGSPALLPFKSRLLRVLIEAYSSSLAPTFEQINLRFLAYESVRAPIGWMHEYTLPSSISLLWNVQTLIIDRSVDKVVAPLEIWEMKQLRHLEFYRVCLPEPPPSDKVDDFALQNLQTVKTILDFKCSEEVCKRMPSIRKLRIFYEDFSGAGQTSSQYCLYNVHHFERLESLSCCFYTVPNRDDLLQNLKFPSSLKKLVLQYCELHWDDLTIIGSLPHLEVLKLKYQAVRGHEWNPVEEEFSHLKFLEIDSCYLINWNADNSHFPVLEKLVLGGVYKLEKIPLDIADISTLQSISVVECSVSAAISAINILDAKVENGEEDLQVRIGFREKPEVEEFKEKVECYGFTKHSFQIDEL